jgi:mono/diheme cytochrome c family protein
VLIGSLLLAVATPHGAANVDAGKQLFNGSCARCHGVDGTGDEGPALKRPDEGNFFALDAETGKPLWDTQLGGQVRSNPMSFAVDGEQYLAVAAGYRLFIFGLP